MSKRLLTDVRFNVISLLKYHRESHPDRLAFILSEDQSISYKDFFHQIGCFAHHLKKRGISKNDRVLIFIPLSLELYLAMFAVQQIGAIAVFLDSWARKDQLQMCVKISSPKAMISIDQAFMFSKGVEELENIPIQISTSQFLFEQDPVDIEPVEPTDPALITFTTGSSGTPKGASRTHRFLLAQHEALKEVIPYNGNEIDLPVFPIFALNNLASGITTVIPKINLSHPSEQDGENLAKQILHHNVDSTTLSPSLFVAVSRYCNHQKLELPSLKRVVTGGAPISRDNVAEFKILAREAEILVLYGSTEVEPIAHIDADQMLACLQKGVGVNVGPISKGLDFKLIRVTKEPITLDSANWESWEVKEGEVGELIVSGAHVCGEYYNDQEAFKKAKIKEPSGKIWHRTGDVGFFDEEKFFWFVGRVHNGIYREGKLLFPLQPELLMKQFQEVKEAAFLGMPHPILGEKSVAIFSLRDPSQKPQGLLDKVKVALEQKEIPVDEIIWVDTIPMDPRHHSKVEYQKLIEQLRSR